MQKACIGDCLACGKCGGLPILDSFASTFAAEGRDGCGIAVDIGTSSVVLALLGLQKGKVLRRDSFMNPQRVFGPDVISRISAAKGNLNGLRDLIRRGIADSIARLTASEAGARITEIVIAGNTVMSYLLLGYPCGSLGAAPFKPEFTLQNPYKGAALFGIDCPVYIVPWLAAFVGGDITAGLLSVRPLGAERFLLIDLGTNGEMALYDGGRLTITATAAGPAFEGSGHSGGASAVLDDLAALMNGAHLGESGILEPGAPPLFTQAQIRDLQLAKSAIRSGLEILLQTAGLAYTDLDAVYLAGGIGQAMNPDSAVTVGLLPGALRSKVQAVGNAALGGAVRLMVNPSARQELLTLTGAADEINLAAHPRFNDYFMDYLMFEVP